MKKTLKHGIKPGLISLLIILFQHQVKAQQHSFGLLSPDKRIEVSIEISDEIRYSVQFKGKQILQPSALALTVEGRGTLGANPKMATTDRQSRDDVIRPVVPQKSKEIVDKYNELTFWFEGNYGVVFRAYNDGIAYRFTTGFGDEEIKVISEQLQFNFAGDYNIYFPEEESFMTHQERSYKYLALSEISPEQFSSIPALVDIAGGPKVLITEADLEDYPGFYLQGTGSAALTGIFPNVAAKEELRSDRDFYVVERAGYLAGTSGSRAFPWRTLIMAEKDGDLIENQMVYKLARPLQLEDPSWINPGKVAWDWWNANNIYDVNFRAGINTQTYKYYIDFASEMGLDYIILDEGWYELGDLLTVNPDMDIPELVEYGRKKNVGIILWVVWKTLEDQWIPAFEQFEKWGVKGIKVDFMQRDDQWMVNWYWKVAKEAAERKLLVDFHGAYKPAGLRRTYPNVITREGVKGLEHNKWSEDITPGHNVTIPFIRMAAGPIDYTPGAMINIQPQNFQPIFNRPMSQGTRCHQLAMYVIYESPLQMLADSPTHYLRQGDEILNYLSEVPVTWDETRVLDAKVGDYVLLARKKGDNWYVGAMTDGNARTFKLDLSFLGNGEYTAGIYSDGINAGRYGEDYRYSTKKVTSGSELEVKMKTGGGWVSIFKPGS